MLQIIVQHFTINFNRMVKIYSFLVLFKKNLIYILYFNFGLLRTAVSLFHFSSA